MNTIKKSPMEVFQAFGQGLMSGTDSWKDVVSTIVTFSGPVDQISGLAAFEKLNAGFVPMIKRNEIKQVVVSGDYVITQVLTDLEMPSGKTIQLDMTEWYEIKEGEISSIKIYYDAEEFRKELV